MLKDCLEVFKRELKVKTDKFIIDNHIPADGTYILLEEMENDFSIKKVLDIKLDKKTKEIDESDDYFSFFREADYLSALISVDKAIVKSKVILSNNYLCFFVKKENLKLNPKTKERKLTEDIINHHYNVLSNPYLKYKSKKNKEIYQRIENIIGSVNCEKIERIRGWLIKNVFNLPFANDGKGYLKIFFDYDLNNYKREGNRYFNVNIYNKNDFNITVNDKLYGLPNDNMSLDSRKPYLDNKSRRIKVPYLMDNHEVFIQKQFFDYLMSFATRGKYNIYIDNKIKGYKDGKFPQEDFSGLFLRIKKGIEVEIQDFDTIGRRSFKLPKRFSYRNILDSDLDKIGADHYGDYQTLDNIQSLIDNILFSKMLIYNYFTEPKDIKVNNAYLKRNILLSRNMFFNWFYKGENKGVENLIYKITLDMIVNSILKGFNAKASHLFNLRWSFINYFKGGESMSDTISSLKDGLRKNITCNDTGFINEDREYFFAVGQMVYYLLSQSKGKKKPLSLVNPFVNAKCDRFIKERLRILYKKYNYDIDSMYSKVKNLYAMILSYEPDKNVDQDMILAGYLHSNLLYESDKKEDK